MSQYHLLSNEEIESSVSSKFSGLRGFRLGDLTKLIAFRVNPKIAHGALPKFIELMKLNDVRVTKPYLMDDDGYYFFLQLTTASDTATIVAALQKWLDQASPGIHVVTGAEPLCIPLQRNFCWVNSELKIVARREAIDTHSAVALFLADLQRTMCDPLTLIKQVKMFDANAEAKSDLVGEHAQIDYAMDLFEGGAHSGQQLPDYVINQQNNSGQTELIKQSNHIEPNPVNEDRFPILADVQNCRADNVTLHQAENVELHNHLSKLEVTSTDSAPLKTQGDVRRESEHGQVRDVRISEANKLHTQLDQVDVSYKKGVQPNITVETIESAVALTPSIQHEIAFANQALVVDQSSNNVRQKLTTPASESVSNTAPEPLATEPDSMSAFVSRGVVAFSDKRLKMPTNRGKRPSRQTSSENSLQLLDKAFTRIEKKTPRQTRGKPAGTMQMMLQFDYASSDCLIRGDPRLSKNQ